jgi:hypothetical protein
MAHHRKSGLESATARLKLTPRRKPYRGVRLSRGLALLYRRNRNSNGAWVAKSADGHGAYAEVKVADADDFAASDGATILTFFEAQDAVKKLHGGGTTTRTTLDQALTAYADDLRARGAHPYNAELVRYHLIGNRLLNKSLALITADELRAWRALPPDRQQTAEQVARPDHCRRIEGMAQ